MARDKRKFKKQITVYKKEIGSVKFEIPITMIFDGTKVLYRAEGKVPHYVSKESESLQEVYDFFDSQISDTSGIKWEPFIQITFEGRAVAFSDEARDTRSSYRNRLHKVDYKLETLLIEIGPDADGQLWQRAYAPLSGDNYIRPYNRTDGFQPQRWANSGLSGSPKPEEDNETLITTIPDTPENRKALDFLTANFEKLRIALFEIITPERITKTLATALSSPGRLLTAMAEDEKNT